MNLFDVFVFTLLLYVIATIQPCSCAVHHLFSETELKHIFGTTKHAQVPPYVISYPVKTGNEEHHDVQLYEIEHEDQVYRFRLESNKKTIIAPQLHAVERNGNASKIVADVHKSLCSYYGKSVSHDDVHMSLTGCGSKARAMIMTKGGDFFFVHPLPPRHYSLHPVNDNGSHPHIVHKRDATYEMVQKNIEQASDKMQVCLFDENDDPFANMTLPEISFSRDGEERLAVTKGPLTVELGAFVDDPMWNHFTDMYGSIADVELLNFVLATVNNIHLLYNHRSLEPKINMVIVKYEVFKTPPDELTKRIHRSGDVDLLLEAFCDFQDQINPITDSTQRHWDHALLFSGYDLYRGKLKSVAGYAPVKGMCSGDRSCTINEGLDFGSVFVVTHEMGHSLGMYHDGDNGCDATCCIMSPSVGSGKTRWSQCSNGELNAFLDRMGTGFLQDNCLTDSPEKLKIDHNTPGLPGQRYNLDQQCRIFHGDCWKHELRDGQTITDVCGMVWCGEGEGIIRTTHPALEGTWCGENRWCIGGECVFWGSVPPTVVHGGWTDWNDNPKMSCTTGCSECQMKNQLRLKRSIRLCENPAPNFGGRACDGSGVRGLVCDPEPCEGPTPDKYAVATCTKLRNDASVPDMLLNGQGFQYADAPCRVWCHLVSSNFIRAVGNFPDGAPCGSGKFCVKGECQTLSCDNKAVVKQPLVDCPSEKPPAPPVPNQLPESVIRQQGLATKSSVVYGWVEWNAWSSCSVSCGTGIRIRQRTCRSSFCQGPTSETGTCDNECSDEYGDEDEAGKDDKDEKDDKGSRDDDDTVDDVRWTTWSEWTVCSATCGNGSSSRKRECQGDKGTCDGAPFEFRSCTQEPCPSESPEDSAEEEPQTPEAPEESSRAAPHSEKGSWTIWSVWSDCVSGSQTRKRTCEDAICEGISTDSQSCVDSTASSTTVVSSTSSSSSSLSSTVSTTTTVSSGTSLTSLLSSSTSTTATQTAATTTTTPAFVPDASGWFPWSAWSPCSMTCGYGIMVRTRNCSVAICDGSNEEQKNCIVQGCAVLNDVAFAAKAAEWSQWSKWTTCSKTCGQGAQFRRRTCHGGTTCAGNPVDSRLCAERILCPSTTESPNSANKRHDKQQDMVTTPSPLESTKPQPVIKEDGWAPWNEWKECTKTCGEGQQRRIRFCVAGICRGSASEDRPCNTEPCSGGNIAASEGNFEEWSQWSECSSTCGAGIQRRKRRCRFKSCSGNPRELRRCNARHC